MEIVNKKGEIIFEDENASMQETVKNAITSNVDFSGADLSG